MGVAVRAGDDPPEERSGPPSPSASGTLILHYGRQQTAELRYVADRGNLYLIPSASTATWSSEIVRAGSAVVTLPGGVDRQVAVDLVVRAEEAERVLHRFRDAFGEPAWERYFAGRPKVIVLRPGAAVTTRSPEDRLRIEFDAVAPRYAEAVRSDPVDSYLRERSTAEMMRLFEGRDPLLEIGCGTGSETLPLLRAGHRITAVDISPEMIREIEGRAMRVGVAERLTTIQGRLRDLRTVLGNGTTDDFAGAYSTFGAFNLEPDLSGVGAALHDRLAPNAPVFLATLNRHAVMPLLVAGAAGRFHELRARLSNPIPAAGSRFPLDVYPLGVGNVREVFAPGFRLERVRAGSLLSPPDDLPRLRRRIGPRGLAAFRYWDERLSKTRWGAELAEWQFLTLRRDPT